MFTIDRFPEVYEKLRADVRRLETGAPGTLGATAVVNELWTLLRRRLPPDRTWRNRDHFVAYSIVAIRCLWLDHLRARRRHDAGGAAERVDPGAELHVLDEARWATPFDSAADIALVHELLERFRRSDVPHRRRGERAVVLYHLTGLTLWETARNLGVSTSTVKGDLQRFRAWLGPELEPRRRRLEAILSELERDVNLADAAETARIVRLAVLRGRPRDEVARVLGCSEARVRSAIRFFEAWLRARAEAR